MKRLLSITLVILMLLASMLMAVSCKKEDDGVERTFTFTAVHADGTSKDFTITSKRTTLADALVDEGLISGENSQYGLYVTTVNGEYHKFEEDGKYWALYINGEYAMTGVDSTNIEDGATYSFKAE